MTGRVRRVPQCNDRATVRPKTWRMISIQGTRRFRLIVASSYLVSIKLYRYYIRADL